MLDEIQPRRPFGPLPVGGSSLGVPGAWAWATEAFGRPTYQRYKGEGRGRLPDKATTSSTPNPVRRRSCGSAALDPGVHRRGGESFSPEEEGTSTERRRDPDGEARRESRAGGRLAMYGRVWTDGERGAEAGREARGRDAAGVS